MWVLRSPKILIWGDVICTLDASSYTHFRPWIQQLKIWIQLRRSSVPRKAAQLSMKPKKFTVYIKVYRSVFHNVSSQGWVRPSAQSCEVGITRFGHDKSFVAKRSQEFGFKRDLRASGDIDYALQAVWSCTVFWKTSPHLRQLFRRVLQHCFSVKLQKCCVGHKTSQLSISMRVNRWWLNLIIGWTVPLSICSIMQLLRGYCEYLHVP